MALYELKQGNGGHGLEVYNTETGKYEKIEFEIEGNKIDSWETLRDLSLDSSQKSIYDSADANFKAEVDNYIKDQYSELLKQEVGRLNRNYEVRNVKKFDNVEEFLNNIDLVITPKLCGDLLDIFSTKGNLCNLSGRAVNSFAIALHKNRYPFSMNEVSKEEYEEKTKNVSVFDYTNEKISDYVKNNEVIPVYRNYKTASMGGKTLDGLKEQLLSSKEDKYDTLLGRSTGNMGSVIYMSPDTVRINNLVWSADFQIKGYVEKSKAKILELNDDTRFDTQNPVIQSFISRRGEIVNKTRSLLIQNNVPSIQAEKICDSLLNCLGVEKNSFGNVLNVSPDVGVIAMLMGYDAVTGNKYEFDILNPGIVNLRGDF